MLQSLCFAALYCFLIARLSSFITSALTGNGPAIARRTLEAMKATSFASIRGTVLEQIIT
jgi:hypothetical protein